MHRNLKNSEKRPSHRNPHFRPRSALRFLVVLRRVGMSLHEASMRSQQHATFRDVEKSAASDVPDGPEACHRAFGHSTQLPHTVLWGPVTREAALVAGCVTASSSILLKPADVPGFADVRQAALACIDPEIYPRSADHAKSLADRLAGCTFLDVIKAKLAGHGRNGKRVDLNSTTYAQPRRVTFSVIARDSACPETVWLYAYTQHGRRPEDFRCRPMPKALFEFGVVLWKLARPYMNGTGPSFRSPPTAMQLMACGLPTPAFACACACAACACACACVSLLPDS